MCDALALQNDLKKRRKRTSIIAVALQYVSRKIQENQKELKLKATLWLLI
jgi:hypothetical protein